MLHKSMNHLSGSVALFGVEMLFLACYHDRCISVLTLLQQCQLVCVCGGTQGSSAPFKDLSHPKKIMIIIVYFK